MHPATGGGEYLAWQVETENIVIIGIVFICDCV